MRAAFTIAVSSLVLLSRANGSDTAERSIFLTVRTVREIVLDYERALGVTVEFPSTLSDLQVAWFELADIPRSTESIELLAHRLNCRVEGNEGAVVLIREPILVTSFSEGVTLGAVATDIARRVGCQVLIEDPALADFALEASTFPEFTWWRTLDQLARQASARIRLQSGLRGRELVLQMAPSAGHATRRYSFVVERSHARVTAIPGEPILLTCPPWKAGRGSVIEADARIALLLQVLTRGVHSRGGTVTLIGGSAGTEIEICGDEPTLDVADRWITEVTHCPAAAGW